MNFQNPVTSTTSMVIVDFKKFQVAWDDQIAQRSICECDGEREDRGRVSTRSIILKMISVGKLMRESFVC